jgi:chorismate mutase
MNGNPPEGRSANADQREQATLLRLEQERDRLNQEVARLRAERDQLAKALLTLLPAEPALPEEEILAQLAQLDKEQPLREFVHEVFKEVGG